MTFEQEKKFEYF